MDNSPVVVTGKGDNKKYFKSAKFSSITLTIGVIFPYSMQSEIYSAMQQNGIWENDFWKVENEK